MGDVERLLEAVLEQPQVASLRLVLADWLEETGDALNGVRAELLRLQVDREQAQQDQRGIAELDSRARQVLRREPALVGALSPILRRKVEPLTLNPTLALVLLADVVAAADGPLLAGSVWTGKLHQHEWAFPTTLTIRERQHNAIEGDMEQDFRSLFGFAVGGTFFFRGVVSRSRLVFATHRIEGSAAWPGLYELELKSGGWLTGTWWLPAEDRRGELRLRRLREG
jgi:uncharacterized protein (TIGR02996 family)